MWFVTEMMVNRVSMWATDLPLWAPNSWPRSTAPSQQSQHGLPPSRRRVFGDGTLRWLLVPRTQQNDRMVMIVHVRTNDQKYLASLQWLVYQEPNNSRIADRNCTRKNCCHNKLQYRDYISSLKNSHGRRSSNIPEGSSWNSHTWITFESKVTAHMKLRLGPAAVKVVTIGVAHYDFISTILKHHESIWWIR